MRLPCMLPSGNARLSTDGARQALASCVHRTTSQAARSSSGSAASCCSRHAYASRFGHPQQHQQHQQRRSTAASAAAADTETVIAPAETVSSSYVSREARQALFGHAEQVPETEASVSGSIPSWLSGSLILNGGADYRGMTHMFDGYAMLSKFRFAQGRVYGSQQYVDSVAYRRFVQEGKMPFAEFATPWAKDSSTLERVFGSMGNMMMGQSILTDNASVNVIPLREGTVLAVSESLPSQYHMDPTSLRTLRQHTYKDGIPGDLTTAHPKIMADGTIVNFTRNIPFDGYHVYKQDPVTLERTEIACIKDRNPLSPCWVHDMTASKDHLVIVENPLYMDLSALVMGSVGTCFQWKPEDGTMVYVVGLTGKEEGTVRSFRAPAFFTFHSANAYEEGGQLHVDVAAYDDAVIVDDLFLNKLLDYPGQDVSRSGLRRFSIPLAGGRDGERLPLPQPLVPDESRHGNFAEFPCVNPAVSGVKHRYVWCNGAVRPTNMGNALLKVDVSTGETAMWHEEGALPGGPTFIAAPGATGEDEGIIVTVVMAAKAISYVLVLDARTMQELGRAELPYAVPYRFHGGFVQA